MVYYMTALMYNTKPV